MYHINSTIYTPKADMGTAGTLNHNYRTYTEQDTPSHSSYSSSPSKRKPSVKERKELLGE
jgi:hypothetical protein